MLKYKTLLAATLSLLISTIWLSSPAIAGNSMDIEQFLETKRCIQCDLSEVEFVNKDLSGARLTSTDLSAANLENSNLSQSDLSQGDLSYAKFNKCQLKGANFTESNLSESSFIEADLSEANLSGAYLVKANFNRANLKGTKFTSLFGKPANLKQVNFSDANLQSSVLRNTNLSSANLSGSDLTKGVDLRGVKLDKANLSNANLSNANLRDASLNFVNLKNTILTQADFSNANLMGSDLTGAILINVVFNNAILDKVVGLDPYGEELLKKAVDKASNQEYKTALKYLEAIPKQTKVYAEAQIKIPEYSHLQKELEAKQFFEQAEEYASSGNYRAALRELEKITLETQPYSEAKRKIVLYTSLQNEANAIEKIRRIEQVTQVKKYPNANGNTNISITFLKKGYNSVGAVAQKITTISKVIQSTEVIDGDVLFFVETEAVNPYDSKQKSIELFGKFLYHSNDLKKINFDNFLFEDIFGIAKEVSITPLGQERVAEYCKEKQKFNLGRLCQ